MKPVVAIVGRPNVGKSTLFNRMTQSRDAIVADFAGLTRDRHYGDGRLGEREFLAVDTGGFEPDSTTGIVKEMAKQTRQAVAEADAVIFVVDVRAKEGAEDQPAEGAAAMDARRIGPNDFVLGIATSGTTPFVHGALQRAKELGAKTGFLLCTPPLPEYRKLYDVVIAVLVVAMGLRLATPALLGRFVDQAIAREPLGSLTALAAVYVAVALASELVEHGVTHVAEPS